MRRLCLCELFSLFGGGRPSQDGWLLPTLENAIERYLVDPASSHMLCSRIKPCMSKYEYVLYYETADSSLYQL